MSLEFFEKLGFSPTSITTKTASYTALVTDDQINITGSGVVLTLPSLLSLQQTLFERKMYAIYNNGATYDLTVQPGTNANTNVADTIMSHASWVLKPGETIVISGESNLLDWKISSPKSLPALLRNNFAIAVNTNGATAVNVFDSYGAPENITITGVLLASLDTTAGYIKLMNGTNVVNDSTNGTAKGTAASVMVPALALTTATIAKGAVCTVVSSSAGNATVLIFGSTQSLVTFAN